MRHSGFVLVVLAAFFISCADNRREAADFERGTDVLIAMKDMHEDSWYRTMTFVQTTIQYEADGSSDTTTWFEAMDLPGRLRIDIGEPADGNTWLFRNDSIYVFNQGTLAYGRPTFHPLLLLGFDAFFIDSETLINKVDSLGIDVDVLSETTWQGRDVYVVGADSGDTDTQQFWIDKEYLYFVRLLQKVGPDGTSQQDVQFNRYEPLGGGWVAPEVEFYVDGNLQMKELYHNMTEGVELDPKLFSPVEWRDADHWLEH